MLFDDERRKMLKEYVDRWMTAIEGHVADEAADRAQKIKERAYQIDPECWISYSGKPKKFKRDMDHRRVASLEKAREETA